MSQVTFTVYARPEPQGSKKGFVKNGRAVLVDDNPKTLRSYRAETTREAIVTLSELDLPRPLAGKHVPVELDLEFIFVKPASVPKRRLWPVVPPDIDKLERATLDALTGVLFVDDAQVVTVQKSKVYGPMEQVRISARTVDPPGVRAAGVPESSMLF